MNKIVHKRSTWVKKRASNGITNGTGSVVGIVTGYRLDGPGFESRWRRNFPHLSIPALGPTQLPVQWVRVLPGGGKRPGPEADPSPPSSSVVKKK